MYWWQHNEKTPTASSGKIQRSFKINEVNRPSKFEDYDITWELDGCVKPEVF